MVIALAVAALVLIAGGVVVWQTEFLDPDVPSSDLVVAGGNQNEPNSALDLQPLLATAQAGQTVYLQIASATQGAAQNLLSSPGPQFPKSLSERLDQAGETSTRVVGGVIKVLSVFADTDPSDTTGAT